MKKRLFYLISIAAALVACNPTPSITSQGTTLSGKLSASSGRVTLTVEGKPPANLDAQGNFRIEGVTSPYTLKVAFPDPNIEGRSITLILENATVSDLSPLLNAWIDETKRFGATTSPPPSSAQIQGSITRRELFQDINLYLTTAQYSSQRGVRIQPPFSQVGAYTLVLKDFTDGYQTSPTGQATLHGFQSSGNYTDLMQTYTAYGKLRLDKIPETGSLENQNFELKKISSTTVTVKPSLPTGQPSNGFYLTTSYQGDPNEGTIALGRGSFDGEGKVALPVTGEGSYYISVGGGSGSTVSHLETLPATLEVALPGPINPISPARDAKVATSQTTLSWSSDPGLFFISLAKSSQTGPFQLLLQAMVPKNELDLKRFGFMLEPNTSYSLNINRVGNLPYNEAINLFSGFLTSNSLKGNFSRLEFSHYDGPFSTLP